MAAKKYQKIIEVLKDEVYGNKNFCLYFCFELFLVLKFWNFKDLEEQQTQSNKLQLSATLNLAASYLKMKEYREALETSQKVLELDPKNEKGMFRMAQSQLGLGFEKEAIATFTKVCV